MFKVEQRDTVPFTTTYTKFMKDFDELCAKHGLWQVNSRGEPDKVTDEPVLHLEIRGVEDDVR